MGLIERDIPYNKIGGRRLTYTITPIGYAAFWKLHKEYNGGIAVTEAETDWQNALGTLSSDTEFVPLEKNRKYITVNIKINQIAYDYHKNHIW